MRTLWLLGLTWTTALAGCSGQYILTAPDQVAPAGGEVRAVVRLQRHEFLRLTPAVEEAVLRFRATGGPVRAGYTDEDGYAGVNVPAPREPGRYALSIAYQDDYGDELSDAVPLYVWEPQTRIVAVDADCLRPPVESPQAPEALRKIAQDARILYLTRADVDEHGRLHYRLQRWGYPDGPVLLWQRRRWRLVEGKWRIPKIEFEDRLVNQLSELRKDFPGLATGVCECELAAKAFAEAGLETILVGDAEVPSQYVSRHTSWAKLSETGL
jgi:hypothetical protein